MPKPTKTTFVVFTTRDVNEKIQHYDVERGEFDTPVEAMVLVEEILEAEETHVQVRKRHYLQHFDTDYLWINQSHFMPREVA